MYRRAGAGLDAATKARLAEIAQRLATLGTSFSQNVLADEQDYTLTLETEDDLAGLPDFVRAAAQAAASRARHDRQARHHAVALQRRAVPAILRPPRPAREGVPRLDRARRPGRRDRQQGGDRRDGGAARRARQAARLRDLCALPARRRHGEDAGRGARPARSGLGAGARRRARRPRRHAGAGAAGGRQLHDRAVGLALLRREAAQGPLRHRRGDGEAVLPASPHHRCGVLHRLQAVRPDLRAPQGRRDLASRRDGVGGDRAGRPSPRPVLRRLLRASSPSARAPG